MTGAATAPDLGAVLVVLRGGAALSRACEQAAWAGARTVFDPAGLVRDGDLPADVRRATDAAGALGAESTRSVLLLTDLESVPTALAAEFSARARGDGAAAVGCAWIGDGFRLTARERSVRLAPRARARIDVDRRLVVTLRTPAAVTALDGALEIALAPDVAAAAGALEEQTRALAHLLWRSGRRPTVRTAAGAAIAAGWSVLRARAGAPAPPRPERWIVAVVAAYRAVLTQARLWELAYAAGTVA